MDPVVDLRSGAAADCGGIASREANGGRRGCSALRAAAIVAVVPGRCLQDSGSKIISAHGHHARVYASEVCLALRRTAARRTRIRGVKLSGLLQRPLRGTRRGSGRIAPRSKAQEAAIVTLFKRPCPLCGALAG